MKPPRRLSFDFLSPGTGEVVRCPFLIVSTEGSRDPEDVALHEITRSAAAALLRRWRRNGMPCRERSPEPLLAAILWRMLEEIKPDAEEAESLSTP